MPVGAQWRADLGARVGPPGSQVPSASWPPVRRRRVILLRARSRVRVSKYVASSDCVGFPSTRATAAMPSNDGVTVESTT